MRSTAPAADVTGAPARRKTTPVRPRPSHTLPVAFALASLAFTALAVTVNMLPWPDMPYQRPPVVVNVALVCAAFTAVCLAGMCWYGAEILHWLQRIDERLSDVERELREPRSSSVDENTVQLVHGGRNGAGRVYLAGSRAAQLDSLVSTVTDAVMGRLNEELEVLDEKADMFDSLLRGGRALRPAAGAESTPSKISWIPRERRGQ